MTQSQTQRNSIHNTPDPQESDSVVYCHLDKGSIDVQHWDTHTRMHFFVGTQSAHSPRSFFAAPFLIIFKLSKAAVRGSCRIHFGGSDQSDAIPFLLVRWNFSVRTWFTILQWQQCFLFVTCGVSFWDSGARQKLQDFQDFKISRFQDFKIAENLSAEAIICRPLKSHRKSTLG
jgi:hypothetical protein